MLNINCLIIWLKKIHINLNNNTYWEQKNSNNNSKQVN